MININDSNHHRSHQKVVAVVVVASVVCFCLCRDGPKPRNGGITVFCPFLFRILRNIRTTDGSNFVEFDLFRP